MEYEDYSTVSKHDVAQDIAKLCGEVTVECSDIAGVISQQLEAGESIRTKQHLLESQSDKLFNELASVVQATNSASELAQNTKKKLTDGNHTIENALGSFHAMIDLINNQSERISKLAKTLDEVKHVISSIDQIARTTNMLALNATIEAEKAGEAGATFAVVASEVKKLSNDTRTAADKITQTVSLLSKEAHVFMLDMENGVNESRTTQNQLSDLKALVGDVAAIINEVESRNIEIAHTTGTIYEAENANKLTRKEVIVDNEEMHTNLIDVNERIHGLDDKSNEMFDIFVKSGLSPDDSVYVEKAINNRNLIRDITEEAIKSGIITMDDVFDPNLIKIPGSNPDRFRNRLSDWADRNWRPIYDEVTLSDDKISSLVCNSQTGYLPTHLSSMSMPPTGDYDYDMRNCRNGRIIIIEAEYIIKQSNEPYTMAVCRLESTPDRYVLSRNIYVPLYINGRRWGDVELAYEL